MHKPLPVAGDKAQNSDAVQQVNDLKFAEERLLRVLDEMHSQSDVDQRWLALGKTHIQMGFMAAVRSIFQPQRIALPEDYPTLFDEHET